MHIKTIIAALAATALAFTLVGCSGSSSTADSSSGGATDVASLDTSQFPTETLKLYDSAPSDYHDLPTITPDELNDMIQSKEQTVIVDVNTAAMYADGHIPGAINIPWDVSGFKQDPGLPRGVKLVFYCVCAEEEDSGAMGLSAVSQWGYRNIVLLKGGTPAWQDAGYSLVS